MPLGDTRRDFIKRAGYMAPAILTLPAAPAYAKSGSQKPDSGKPRHEKDGDFDSKPKKK